MASARLSGAQRENREPYAANETDDTTEDVDFDDVVEWLLVSEVSIRRMPHLERSIPGFTAAMFVWRRE